jgi:hypothetical protein
MRSLEDRFVAKVKRPVSGEGCWLWTGATNPRGYGSIIILKPTKRVLSAHRVAYELYVGEIPAGMSVLHRCDVRNCVNPMHLWLGTQADNMADMNAKGRQRAPASERSSNAKLTWPMVRELRSRIATGLWPLKELAKEYGIAYNTLLRVKTQQTWREP